jgi:hypothetical protein
MREKLPLFCALAAHFFDLASVRVGRAARRCGSAALLRGTKDAVMVARYRPKIYLYIFRSEAARICVIGVRFQR